MIFPSLVNMKQGSDPASPVKRFFFPRLVHFRSQYEQTPGLVRSDWREPKLSWTQKILRLLLCKVRQGTSSPPGMSKLPFELLDMIFRELCGKEVHAVRLICSEWEVASRPFFAERHLRPSLFWLTPSDLKRLEDLARRFGPYMRDMHIATDHFTISGLLQVWRNYKAHTSYIDQLAEAVIQDGKQTLLRRQSTGEDENSSTLVLGSVHQALRDTGHPRNQYFRHAYQQRHPISPWKHRKHHTTFARYFLGGILTQAWMRLTGSDRRRLARIATMMPQGRLVAARLSYTAEKLNQNELVFGRASPGFATKLALLCGNGNVFVDGEYGEHVERVVGEVMRRRAAQDK